MKILFWSMIIIFGVLSLLNLSGLRAIQNWAWGNFENPLLFIEILGAVLVFFMFAWVLDVIRVGAPEYWAILPIAAVFYCAYWSLQPDPDPTGPSQGKIYAAATALLFSVSAIIGQVRQSLKRPKPPARRATSSTP